VAVITSYSSLPSLSTALPQPSSVRRKGSLSRLPAPGLYVAGRTSALTRPPSGEPGDGSVKSALPPKPPATTNLAACPTATDKRKTVTAVRSLSMRNYNSKSGPLKAVSSIVTSVQSDCVDGLLQFFLVTSLISNLATLKIVVMFYASYYACPVEEGLAVIMCPSVCLSHAPSSKPAFYGSGYYRTLIGNSMPEVEHFVAF